MGRAVSARTSYARAVREYDEAFERELVETIMEAIAQASLVSDANCCVMRTGETASALVTVLAATLALSPAAVRLPAAIRKLTDEIRHRLLRRISQGQADADEFRGRCFTSTDVEGSA
jgi:hypothetical protein